MASQGIQVIVRFPPDVPLSVQGPLLLEMEKTLRAMKHDFRVVKDLQGDDSKLRVMMTPEMRAKL